VGKKSFIFLKSFTVFLAFVALFFYFYKKSGRFRKSIASAYFASIIFVSAFTGLTSPSGAKDVEGFTPKLPQQSQPNKNSGFFGSESGSSSQGPGKPNGNGGGGESFPGYPQTESVQEMQARIDDTEHQLDRLREVTESDSELEESDSELEEDVEFDSKFECKADTTTKTQAGLLYVDDDKNVIIEKVYEEAVRRAKKIDPSSDCDFERIQQLVTEHTENDKDQRIYAAKETITAVQAEAEGIFKRGSGRRVNLGYNKDGPIQGLDMAVEGTGRWSHITHVDFKNPVGEKIRAKQDDSPKPIPESTAAIPKRKIKEIKENIKKMKGQIKFWTNETKYSTVPGIVKNPDLPKSPDNILMIIDLFDVPEPEKAEMKREMMAAAEGKIKNMIFLNDEKNI
jgi:hypothetical protein